MQPSWRNDEIVLTIGKEQARRLTDYRVESSVFRQPSAFSCRIGRAGGAAGALADMLNDKVIGQPCALHLVAEGRQAEVLQTARLDAIAATDERSEVEYRGRDMLAPLFDSYFLLDRSFSESSYYDITAQIMRLIGMDPEKLLVTGEEGRKKAVSGRVAPKAYSPSTDARTQVVEQTEGNKTRVVYNTIKAEVGANLYQWLKEQYKRAGLFLWSDPKGRLQLTAPNADQEPLYEIVRLPRKPGEPRDKYGATAASCHVVGVRVENDTSELHSHVHVFGRAGGGKDGRRVVSATYASDLIERGLRKEVSYKEDVRTQKEAEFLAHRLGVEERRNAFKLEYTVAGHSARNLLVPGTRIPWAVDTVVRVKDDVTGIEGDFYIGDITFSRSNSSGTTTTLRLYRPNDLVFAESASE
jgi:prophage tail gpP-like protein